MKIKSVEKFRNELYKNLKELWFGIEYTIYEASKCMFKNEDLKPENRNILGCRSLENVLVIQKSHRDENFKQIIDDELLITVCDDGVYFYTKNTKEQRFCWWDEVRFKDCFTKMLLVMEITIKIVNFTR